MTKNPKKEPRGRTSGGIDSQYSKMSKSPIVECTVLLNGKEAVFCWDLFLWCCSRCRVPLDLYAEHLLYIYYISTCKQTKILTKNLVSRSPPAVWLFSFGGRARRQNSNWYDPSAVPRHNSESIIGGWLFSGRETMKCILRCRSFDDFFEMQGRNGHHLVINYVFVMNGHTINII